MSDILNDIFLLIFNFLGALIRWIFCSLWRFTFKKPKFTFKQYLNGPELPYDKFDEEYDSKNTILGGIFFIALIVVIVKFIFLN